MVVSRDLLLATVSVGNLARSAVNSGVESIEGGARFPPSTYNNVFEAKLMLACSC